MRQTRSWSAAAERHGIAVSEGGIFTPMVPGAYNLRVPRGSVVEVRALAKASGLTLLCMDYRQSFAVCQALKLNVRYGGAAVFASAGGAAQPERERFDASVAFVAAFHRLKSLVGINLVTHDGVCGGANHFTHGMMRKLHDGNPEGEREQMISFLEAFGLAVVEKGVNPQVLKMWIAQVDAGQFIGLEEIGLP